MPVRLWRKGSTHPLQVGVQACTATMEISTAVPQEDRNRSTSRYTYRILGHMPKRQFILPQRHILNHIYCSSIHDSQKLETTFNRIKKKNKTKLWHTYVMEN